MVVSNSFNVTKSVTFNSDKLKLKTVNYYFCHIHTCRLDAPLWVLQNVNKVMVQQEAVNFLLVQFQGTEVERNTAKYWGCCKTWGINKT